MTTTAPTRPVLLPFESATPVRFQELGTGGKGIDWTVQPENLAGAIEMVNTYGGPDCWRVTVL